VHAPKRPRGLLPSLAVVACIVAAVTAGVALGRPAATAPNAGDWLAFGRTPDNNRYSPLTSITPANVDQLGRAYTIDFLRQDPDTRRGQQSYPLAIDGTLFVTTNDANVFAIDGATGRILWQRKPTNSALFKNFGVVANRGLAYCGGRLFILQLDMKLVAINPSNGDVLGEVALSQDVPNATANYGYSQTSAPICANNTLVFGAAGSERGNRGFVMAYKPNLQPAWPSPFWTIPPDLQGWRKSRLVGGGPVWTPVTIDASTNTVYFGTGSATPVYYPALRPGPNPRTGALIAVDLRDGRMKWWRQLLPNNNQWEYDVAQPPLVYNTKIGGQTRRVVSVGTKEGTWFAFDARTGQPIHERVKVIDRVEHPPLKPGQPVTIFPGSIGGLNYSPAAFDPKTNFVFNAAAETAGVLIQDRLSPTQKKRKLLLGDVYLGLENGTFGGSLAGWKDHGSISAINASTGRRVWKFNTPEPERGGVTVTASGLGFAGGGDGVLRAFDLKTGKVYWTFQTGRQIAAGPTIFTAGGKEYIAITVGGTPTSSGGGLASQLQVFAIGGSKTQSPSPLATGSSGLLASGRASSGKVDAAARPAAAQTRSEAATAAPAGRARIVIEGGALTLTTWTPSTSNLVNVHGRLLYGGAPVAGARIAVDRYVLPAATAADGRFTYPVDSTLARRHPVRVVDASRASVGGRVLAAAAQRAVRGATSGISVGYRIANVNVTERSNGNVVISGRALRADGAPTPPVVLLSYRLSGRITDAAGNPVRGATVVTRSNDRDFWTFSDPSDVNGRYTGFFPAADKSSADPVEFAVQIAYGRTSYTTGARNPSFKRLSSSTMDVRLPASGVAAPLPTTTATPGAIYRGLLVGVSGRSGVVKPVSATWPDAGGRFTIVLPPSVKGQTLRFWQSDFQTFTTRAAPGAPVILTWPTLLSPRVPRDTGFVRITG
jgi:alcohol dehydrogenase (cytochrome c)